MYGTRHSNIQGQRNYGKALLFNFEGPSRSGGIAQLGEHLLCKQGVSGSIPLISTKGLRIEPNLYGLIAQPVRASA